MNAMSPDHRKALEVRIAELRAALRALEESPACGDKRAESSAGRSRRSLPQTETPLPIAAG